MNKNDKSTKEIILRFKEHHQKIFSQYKRQPKGVDWRDQQTADIRYKNMLALLKGEEVSSTPTVLDVGCGYGGLFEYAQKNSIELHYTGIDIVPELIQEASTMYPDVKFLTGDILENKDIEEYDYIVCNGILTQKLETSLLDMDNFAKLLIKKMFSICKKGICFNIMSTYVNFFVANLHYKHPTEVVNFCFSELSHNVKLDHSYGLYEYTVYVYKN